ncbi:hypothetical protein [Streptomyces sp. NPDC056543]|uniref:hypothetical protein n=1 Tax=unclassified Streptomyces TaxID=2593676 RepID=UPI003674A1B6
MSDVLGGFEDDAEDALDTLLAQYQSSLVATVGPALDVTAGLRNARTPTRVIRYLKRSSFDSSHRPVTYYMQVVTDQKDCLVSNYQSSALAGAMDAVHYEEAQFRALADDINAEHRGCPAPSADLVSPVMAAQIASEELVRLLTLLRTGVATKDSAASGFVLAEKVITDQVLEWEALLSTPSDFGDRDTWMHERFAARLDGLVLLRERIVKLFEDAEDGAYQLS